MGHVFTESIPYGSVGKHTYRRSHELADRELHGDIVEAAPCGVLLYGTLLLRHNGQICAYIEKKRQ